jgi:hypothetical protein
MMHDYIRRVDELIRGERRITTDGLSSTLPIGKGSNNNY